MLVYCPKCETANKPQSLTCSMCGYRLQKSLPTAADENAALEFLTGNGETAEPMPLPIDDLRDSTEIAAQVRGEASIVIRQESTLLLEAQRAATTALILAIIGIFFLGLVFGVLALVKADQAERLARGRRGTIHVKGARIIAVIDIVVHGSLLLAYLAI